MKIRRLASIKTADEFSAYLKDNGITLPFSREVPLGKATSLARPYVS